MLHPSVSTSRTNHSSQILGEPSGGHVNSTDYSSGLVHQSGQLHSGVGTASQMQASGSSFASSGAGSNLSGVSGSSEHHAHHWSHHHHQHVGAGSLQARAAAVGGWRHPGSSTGTCAPAVGATAAGLGAQPSESAFGCGLFGNDSAFVGAGSFNSMVPHSHAQATMSNDLKPSCYYTGQFGSGLRGLSLC